MEFKIGDRIRITNYNGCLNDKFGYIVKIINDDHPLPKYCIQLSDKVIDSRGNTIKVAQLRLSNSQLVKYEEILEDDKYESTENHDVLSYTIFDFKNKELNIELHDYFDKYLLLESIECFIKTKFYNWKKIDTLRYYMSRAVAISKNDFKDTFSNLYKAIDYWVSGSGTDRNDDIYFLRDIFLLLSTNGEGINQKDFDILQNKNFYEGLSYKVVTIKFRSIKEGDVVRIIDTGNEYYGFYGIVKSIQCCDQHYSYSVSLRKNRLVVNNDKSIGFDNSTTELVYTEDQIEKVYKDE